MYETTQLNLYKRLQLNTVERGKLVSGRGCYGRQTAGAGLASDMFHVKQEMTMTTFQIEDTELYSDDTFTLAFGSPETESEESTPDTLARAFTLQSLEELRDSLSIHQQRHANEIEKLGSAIANKSGDVAPAPATVCPHCEDGYQATMNGLCPDPACRFHTRDNGEDVIEQARRTR